MKPCDVILFDIGGVLVELDGFPFEPQWSALDLTDEEFWKRWLDSRAVRDFEGGRSTPEEFAKDMVKEFALSVEPGLFLRRFRDWPRAPYPMIRGILDSLYGRYELGCLSNSNAIHWKRFTEEIEEFGLFEYCFLSHDLGMLKPDREIFRHVIHQVETHPGRIFYVDDTSTNVEAASLEGITAHRVKGDRELTAKLRELELLSSIDNK